MIFSQMRFPFSEGANPFGQVIFRLAQFLVEHELFHIRCLSPTVFFIRYNSMYLNCLLSRENCSQMRCPINKVVSKGSIIAQGNLQLLLHLVFS